MKKAGIIFLCGLVVFALGCKKRPAEPVSVPPSAVGPGENQPQDNKPQVNGESTPAVKKPVTRTAAHLEWMTDFEAAKKKAAAEGKDLLINFTGSDWCPACVRLEKEVFGQNIFIYEAQKHFVFMMADFPRSKAQSEELKSQNERLSRRYRVDSFPTIILADATGKPYAQTSYLDGGPLVYLRHLARLRMQRSAGEINSR